MKALPIPTKQQGDKTYIDTRDRGRALVLRVSYGGRKTWKILYYDKRKNEHHEEKTVPIAKKIGEYPALSEDAAYKKVSEFNIEKAKAAHRTGSFGQIAKQWLAEGVYKKGLRSASEIERQLNTYVLPRWAEVPLYDIRLRQVNDLLDDIRDKKIINAVGRALGGPSQADAVLATIRCLMIWYKTIKGDDDYDPPIKKYMKLKRDHRSFEEKSRDRVLSDDEIRALWSATENFGRRGALIRLLLLTGQRLRTVARMRWEDIVDGTWRIPRVAQAKGNIGTLKLAPMALAILERIDRVSGNPYIFPSSRGNGALEAFSQLKSDVNKLMPNDMPHWVLHDLRRTARTRMADLGINDRIAELTLGHKINGIEGVYNRSDFTDRKSLALSKLADHINDVVMGRPASSNVVNLRSA